MDEMTPDRWKVIKETFQETIDRPESERAAFLDERCARDVALRRELEVLVDAYRQLGGFLELSDLLNNPKAPTNPEDR